MGCVPTLWHTNEKYIPPSTNFHLLEFRSRKPGFDSVTESNLFEPILFGVWILNFDAWDVDDNSLVLLHSEHQVAALGIRECRKILQEFL